jgi:hypothetical protein
MKSFLTLLVSKPALYLQDFATYANEQFKKIAIPLNLYSTQQLNDFYLDPFLQNEIKKMMVVGLIRGECGRLLELYLLLDRLFYLEEAGYKAELSTFFSNTISPRNIGLWAMKIIVNTIDSDKKRHPKKTLF